jgi:hypothetical protein
MRTLNRPMFRYGGPIKEGVMNGIREPKKHGGSMGPNEGPRRAALVGDPNFPQTDGRAHHVAPIIYGAGMAAARLAPMALRGLSGLKKAYQGFKSARTLTPGKLGKFGRLKDMVMPGGRFRDTTKPTYSINKSLGRITEGSEPYRMGILQSLKDPKRLGAAIRENPFTALSALTLPNMALNAAPIVGKGALGAGKMFIDAVLPGEQFRGDEKETEAAVLEKLTTDTIEKVLSPAEEKALAADKKAQAEAAAIAGENFAKAQKEKRIEGYREIMDIKGMNKDAAYNSLIAASQAVLGEGDFKGSLKDGSLINKIIGTTSQAFDKPAKTKDAINSLILKGEIEKNINQGKEGSQMKAAKDFASAQGISVTQAYKDLGFSKTKNLSENIAIVSKSQGGIGLTTDSVAEGLRMTYPELGVPNIIGTDAELIKLKKENSLYRDQNDAAIFEDLAVKNKLGDGLYVLGTSSFTITDGKLDQLR